MSFEDIFLQCDRHHHFALKDILNVAKPRPTYHGISCFRLLPLAFNSIGMAILRWTWATPPLLKPSDRPVTSEWPSSR